MKKRKNGMEDLLQYEGFRLKIEADADGLSIFSKARKRHTQEGPDILSVEAQGSCLDFKTTFSLGQGAAQNLSCAIAGKVCTVTMGDMTPEDWQAFADKLHARNQAVYLRDRLSDQSKISEEYHTRYESSDPEAVVEFIREYHWALKEPWVAEAVSAWGQTGEFDLLKRAFQTHKGERPSKFDRLVLQFFLTERIDRLRAKGMTATKAFETVEVPGNTHLDPLRIRNIYYATKKKTPQIHVQKTSETLSITAYNAKVQMSLK